MAKDMYMHGLYVDSWHRVTYRVPQPWTSGTNQKQLPRSVISSHQIDIRFGSKVQTNKERTNIQTQIYSIYVVKFLYLHTPVRGLSLHYKSQQGGLLVSFCYLITDNAYCRVQTFKDLIFIFQYNNIHHHSSSRSWCYCLFV